jgi:phosphoglycerate dehydrogenase-like enzyme
MGGGVRLTILRCSEGPVEVVEALRSSLAPHDFRICAEDRVLHHVGDADVIIPARASITEAVLDAAVRCRLIQQGGAGLDTIDLEAARKRGIPVANVPTRFSGMAESVAEMALWLTIGILRRQPDLARAVLAGDWRQAPVGRALCGKSVGIVGLGGIGVSLARMLRPFDCRVLAVKRRPDQNLRARLKLAWLGSMDELPVLLRESDVVVLAIPLTAATRSLLGREQLALMKRGACLVNVSRGGVVDRTALEAGIAAGHLDGAGLDVFWDEPARPDDPLLKMNVLLTPHVGGYTDLMLQKSCAIIAGNIQRLAGGERLLHEVP